MASAAALALANKNSKPLTIAFLVTVLAGNHFVLRFQRPACLKVIELFDAPNGFPAHQIEAAAAMLLMTLLAFRVLHSRRGMEALVGGNALAQVFMVVTPKAFAAGQRLAIGVALIAVLLAIQGRVT